MQEIATIARPYAEAAFELAREQDALERWSDALEVLAVIVSDPQLRAVAGDPRVGGERTLELIFAVGGDRFFDQFRNFIRVLVAAARLPAVVAMLVQFQRLRAQAEGVAQVEVVSAYPLEPHEEQRIAAAVQRRGDRQVRVTQRVDESLIGGAIIRSGDSVIDASLRGRLQHMTNRLRQH